MQRFRDMVGDEQFKPDHRGISRGLLAMTQSFLDKVYDGRPIQKGMIAGYSNDEIVKIEKLYDISVLGDFRQFLSEMGRCSGGLFSGGMMAMCRPHMSVRSHVLENAWIMEAAQSVVLKNPNPVDSLTSNGFYNCGEKRNAIFLFTDQNG